LPPAEVVYKIAFGSARDDGEEIYVMNADGSEPVRLTFAIGPDANPDWSPRGDLSLITIGFH
jgi:TolB protein